MNGPGNNGTFRLDNKVAVVTGGGSGIGHSIAEIFAGHGACVHVVDMDGGHAESVASEIRNAGGKAKAHTCDVSIRPDVKRVFDEIMQHEPIDILVNNAGIAHVGKLEDTPEEEFDHVFKVNVKGVYNCMLCCTEHMKSRRKGVILNLASIASSAGLPDRFAYSMSKGAVLTMTYSVARDYMGYNIRCNCISPARVYTPFVEGFVRKNYPGREKEMFEKLAQSQPIGRMADVREVVGPVVFLASDASSYVTGANLVADGGWSAW